MQNYSNKRAGLISSLDCTLIITFFSALVTMPDDFAPYFVGPFKVLSELSSVGTHFVRQFRQRRADINKQPHLAADCESVRRNTFRLGRSRANRLEHRCEQ